MRSYWTAHELARRGHQLHVVTNANEVQLPYRMFMRSKDWDRCGARYSEGSVTVHWTEQVNKRQARIPQGRSFITKLVSLALQVIQSNKIDIIYSYYTEPYGVAGYIVSQATGIPHVTRTAGSDAGRLWKHEQYQPLFDEVYRTANVVLTGKSVSEKMLGVGVSPDRIKWEPEVVNLGGSFKPNGPVLDIARLIADARKSEEANFSAFISGEYDPKKLYFGVYGKLGRSKGSFALLKAIARLKAEGHHVGLLAMAHSAPNRVNVDEFWELASRLNIEAEILQLPYVPHWRVPEFIRACSAVCCLEQDFPIEIHTPVVAREILTSGRCLIASKEMIEKVRGGSKLVSGYNCIAVNDVFNIDELTAALRSILDEPELAGKIGRRGRLYGVEIERHNAFPTGIERTLQDCIARQTTKDQAEEFSVHGTSNPQHLTQELTDFESISPAEQLRVFEKLNELCFEKQLTPVLAPLASKCLDQLIPEHLIKGTGQTAGGKYDSEMEMAGNFELEEYTSGSFGNITPIRSAQFRLLKLNSNVRPEKYMSLIKRLERGVPGSVLYIVIDNVTVRVVRIVGQTVSKAFSLSDGKNSVRDIIDTISKSDNKYYDEKIAISAINFLIKNRIVVLRSHNDN